jgi:hypothetical protein
MHPARVRGQIQDGGSGKTADFADFGDGRGRGGWPRKGSKDANMKEDRGDSWTVCATGILPVRSAFGSASMRTSMRVRAWPRNSFGVRRELDDGSCTRFALAGRQWHAASSILSFVAREQVVDVGADFGGVVVPLVLPVVVDFPIRAGQGVVARRTPLADRVVDRR